MIKYFYKHMLKYSSIIDIIIYVLEALPLEVFKLKLCFRGIFYHFNFIVS